jgi:hypothetical protein
MRKGVFMLVCGVLAFSLSANRASAVKPFLDQFKAKYTKPEGTEEEKQFAALVEKTGCNVCHEGKNRKNRNPYGVALSKLLKKTDQKNKEKVQQSLDKVAEEKSADGATYGELISEHKLPAGEPK